MKYYIVFFLSFVSLYAQELSTCYSVQLLSFPSTQDKTSVHIPDNCQIITIGRSNSIRCGCKKNFKEIKQDLLKYKSIYKNAILVNTYMYRFNEKVKHLADESLTEQYNKINWEKYTIKTLKRGISQKLHGSTVNLIPIKRLYFLSKGNTYEHKKLWKKAGILWPNVIVLANGRYDIHTLHKLVDDNNIIEKVGKDSYLIKRPIYISPTASLLIENVTIKLSNNHGAFMVYHGGLDIVSATVTSWNIDKSNYGPRKHIKYNELLFYLKQEPRPYLLALEGSFSKIIDSDIIGLGYKGQSGTFGISFSKSMKKLTSNNLKSIFRKREKPEGILAGNNISKCFFGLYANNAKNVFLIGNILHDNIIYNFDPHDFSDKLIIARNISYNAGHAHGIILSREVYNSTIAENITFANHGSGIMLDRNCEDNLIYKNLSFENSGDGIAIFESSKNIVSKNTILRNNNNGIFVRNSHNVLVKDNFIYHNGNNGAEISIVNIDALETRDFELDPYEKKAQASFIRNHFEKNTNAALSIKNRASFFFKNNILKNSGPVYFSGEIEDIANEIFQNNDTKGFSYTPTEVKK